MEPGGDALSGANLELILRHVNEISTIPAAAMRVMQVVNDPRTNATELAEAVGRDPALSARLMRTVNAAAYGLRTKVRRLADAVTQLGFRRVRNLALAALVCDLFRGHHTFGRYDRGRLWRHMVGVAIGARAMAVACAHKIDSDEAFLAGLLHDIGIILEDQCVHQGFARAVSPRSPRETLLASEVRHLGFDHTELGARVGAAWRLPDATVHAIAHHHRPEEYDGPEKGIVYLAAVANWVCTDIGIPSVDMPGVPLPSDATLAWLGLEREQLGVFGEDIKAEQAPGDLLLVV